ncbi:nucleotidyl transferase AbiEii/AbiGii toxin family protein [Cupriavidus sp. AcVe19-6a]|uniref:nucleotidyl transferase AbiEii/AbiGii toxin family protein n=2 Tax=unclassified Cupriavidus TaxID=2640874 RepID=UPI001AE136BC|nr:nucleotidyl transferase AbiEii/AbiGii toxin family protein [Cupriavidus sp. AcVe19-6a]MBP0639624.1 nucleotidyl transferase AbiEii/AbiGii toxin family protein [Cupriavidus sp. AcVe19-6a]
MDKVAKLPADDRAALFGETGAGRGVANTIIEKDFWVCWTLKRLFGLQRQDAAALVFKGGTSLSKAFGAIRRFSEDIDLSFDRADLGYTGDRDPEMKGISGKQANQLIKELIGDVEDHIAQKLLPSLRAAIVEQLGEPSQGRWFLEIDNADAQTVNFHYPTALQASEYEGMAYITPRVKLELGARGDPWPTEQRVIRPYAAEDYPSFFEDSTCTVTVLSARRTFWEKATALHAEAHRPMETPTPQYFSRHYYDLAMLFDTEEGKQAATDFGLLAQVVTHKATFFRSSWARYDLAKPGTLQLIPNTTRIKDLRIDYRAMAPMMFDENPPSFEDVLARVENLERTING